MFAQKKNLGLKTIKPRNSSKEPKKKSKLLIPNEAFFSHTKSKREGLKNWQLTINDIPKTPQISDSSSSVGNNSDTGNDIRSTRFPSRGHQSHSQRSSESDTESDNSVSSRKGWYLERRDQVKDKRESIFDTHENYRSPERQSSALDQTFRRRSRQKDSPGDEYRHKRSNGSPYNNPEEKGAPLSGRNSRQYELLERRSFSASPERRLSRPRSSIKMPELYDDRETFGDDDILAHSHSADNKSEDAMTKFNRFKSKSKIDQNPRVTEPPPRPHIVKKKTKTVVDGDDTTRLYYTTTISKTPFSKQQTDKDHSATDTDGEDSDSTRPPTPKTKKTPTFESDFDKSYTSRKSRRKPINTVGLIGQREIERAKFQALRDTIMRNRELARNSMKSGKNLILMDSLENRDDITSTLGPRERGRKKFLDDEIEDLHNKIGPVQEKLFGLSDSPAQIYVLVLWKFIVSVFNIIGFVTGVQIYGRMFWFIQTSEFMDHMLSLNTTKYILNIQNYTIEEILIKDVGFDIFEKGFRNSRNIGYTLFVCHSMHFFATCLELIKLKSAKVKWISPLIVTIVWGVIVTEYWNIILRYLIIPREAQGSISEFINAYTPVTKANPTDYIYLLGQCCGFYGPEDFEIRSDMTLPNNTDGTLVNVLVPPVCCKREVLKKTVDDLIVCSQSASPINNKGCFQYLQQRLKSKVKLYTWTLFNLQLVDIILITICYARFVSKLQKYNKLTDQLNDFETEMVLLLHEFPEKVFKRQKLGDIVEKEENRRGRHRRDKLTVELDSNGRTADLLPINP